MPARAARARYATKAAIARAVAVARAGSEADLLAEKARADGSLVLQLTHEMVALVEGLGARGTLTADPELLGAPVFDRRRRGPTAVGAGGEGRERQAAIEDDLRPGSGAVGDDGVGFTRILARERDGLGQAIGASGDRHLHRLPERTRPLAEGAPGAIQRREGAIGVRGVWLGQLAGPVVVAVRGDVQFQGAENRAGERGERPDEHGGKTHEGTTMPRLRRFPQTLSAT